MSNNNPILKVIKDQKAEVVGITGSPSTTIEIAIDIKEESKLGRILGQMVYFVLQEEGQDILVIGQVTAIETQNRWHQDPSFKGVIRLHGSLPHLSGRADNRIASISVQAAYVLGDAEDAKGHILGTSPSTGEEVKKMNNAVMGALMKQHEKEITYMGKVYGTDVDMPFWFRHFDKGECGAGDAHHIGVFGKSGSGKSVAAAYMLLGYAKNKDKMNILLIDPQGQFYSESDFPQGFSLEESVKKMGMKFEKHHILEDLYLPGNDYELFASLLQKNKFIRRTFNIMSDRENEAAAAIADYLLTLNRESKGGSGNLNALDEAGSKQLMRQALQKFVERKDDTEIPDESASKKGRRVKTPEYSRYATMVYSQKARIEQMIEQISGVLTDDTLFDEMFTKYWHPIVEYFTPKKTDGKPKQSVRSVIQKVASENNKGNFIVLNISGEKRKLGSENIKAMFVRIIENEIKNAGEELYTDGKKVNCLVVMDEAHRYISYDSSDPQIIELTKEIVDSVRTTRKYGIGYMFITQTIESLDKEILQQIRIFAFGYGLTVGSEIKTISNLVNNESAIQLYRSFIDPSSNHKYPFMFFGSVSPLSFTGSPLFIEVYNDPKNFR
jgi:hypothetical protein